MRYHNPGYLFKLLTQLDFYPEYLSCLVFIIYSGIVFYDCIRTWSSCTINYVRLHHIDDGHAFVWLWVSVCMTWVKEYSVHSLETSQGLNVDPLGAVAQSFSPSGATPLGCCQTVAVLFQEYSGLSVHPVAGPPRPVGKGLSHEPGGWEEKVSKDVDGIHFCIFFRYFLSIAYQSWPLHVVAPHPKTQKKSYFFSC